ncbi:MAG TPA: hypothetical protein VFU47_09720 [Armatimonadota bacterium]|nr:hypothetical protein [Armatimonadota bacterium]
MRLTRLRAPGQDWLEQLRAGAGEGYHLLCPAGIGDLLWIWCKWGGVARHRPVTFYLPAGEQQRAGQFLSLVGGRADYRPGLNTPWVWRQDPMPPFPERGGLLVVHANGHLEAGRPLREWYPELPLRYPEPDLSGAWDRAPLPFVLAFACHEQYMGGNHPPAVWAEMLRTAEREVAPVRLVGAGRDVPFIREIRRRAGGGEHDLVDRPLADLLLASTRAAAMFGVAGGPIIAAQCLGCPSLFFYPDHLARMPGTWERPEVPWDWGYVRDAPELIRSGRLTALAGERRPLLPNPPVTLPRGRAPGGERDPVRERDGTPRAREIITTPRGGSGRRVLP